MVELIPVDEAFASSLEYLLKALPLWLFFNENFPKLIQNLSKFIQKLSKYIQNWLHKFCWKIQSGWIDPCWWGLCLIVGVSPQGPSTLVVFQWKFPFFRTKKVIFKYRVSFRPFLGLAIRLRWQFSQINSKSIQIYSKTVQIYSELVA